MRRLLPVVILLLAAVPTSADVVVLKSGGKLVGRVADKETHYEVTTDAGLRTVLKDEVEKIVTSPKEVLGDADKLVEEAKDGWLKGVAASSGQDGIFREAVAKVTKAREAYAQARELFPDDKYAELDTKLVQIMQLLRLLRERMGSQYATSGTGTRAPAAATPADALEIVRDPAQRADAAKRQAAIERLKGGGDLAAAMTIFLSRSDAEWRLQGPSLEAVQAYFKRSEATTPESHLEAARWIAKTDASSEVLRLFGAAHLSNCKVGPETEKTARALGLDVLNGNVGTTEGNVVVDLARWIRAGDNDLAVLAWLKEYRGVDSVNVRYVWSIALLRLAHQRGRGFERAMGGIESIKGADATMQAHVVALVKSIKASMNCGTCSGEGRWRCTNCHGKKDIHILCKACEGTGKMKKSGGFQLDNCPKCKSTGIATTLHCSKCKDGYVDCSRCQEARACPDADAICTVRACGLCGGTGSLFRGVRWTCPCCRGLGEVLAPKADGTKTLDAGR